ncbi:MAG TPA: AAA family ATPase [Pseudonocardiaceae bacterium]|nr:AAA family ATPase [Pseudonocardiaceae bacterium]
MPEGDGAARFGLIDRDGLVAELDRATGKQVTAPAGSGKTSLLRLWADRAAHDRRIAFLSVRPGQRDPQQFWLALLGAVRDTNGAQPPTAPGFDGPAAVDKVLSEIRAADGPLVLIIDDLHELDSPTAAAQLTSLLTRLPRHAHAILATRAGPPLLLHRPRLAGQLAEIRDLRFTEQETRQLVTIARLGLPDHVTALLHQRTEGWAAGLRLAVLSLAGHPDPERFVTEFSGSDRTAHCGSPPATRVCSAWSSTRRP